MKKKLYYEAPETEVFEVRLDGGMLMGSPNNAPNWSSNPGGVSGNDSYDDTGSY